MTVSRLDWSGTFGIEAPRVAMRAHTSFGWTIHQYTMPPGAKLITKSSRHIERAKAPNVTLFVRGRATVTGADGTSYPDRLPGVFSPERGDVPQGAVTTLAVTEFEFWCMNWTVNRGSLPQLQALRIAEEQDVTLPAGQRVLVCLGQLGDASAGGSLVASGAPLRASASTYGLLIGGGRA